MCLEGEYIVLRKGRVVSKKEDGGGRQCNDT